MSEVPDRVLVVGGGVIGVCSAYYLAREGMEVVLLERDEVGAGASSGNAGVVAPGHGPINKPGRVRQAMRWMFDRTSPLYIPPRPAPDLVRWLWTFRAHCTAEHLERSLEVLGPLGHLSRELLDALVEEEGLECSFRPEGYYEVYRTEGGLAAARRELELVRKHGYRPTELGGDELREREPALREGTRGGIHHPEAASLDPRRFLDEVAARAVQRGVEMRTGRSVVEVVVRGGKIRGVRTEGGEVVEGRRVLLATGAYSLALARRVGVRIPIQAAKGYHRDRDPEVGGAPPLRITCVLGERFVFCTPMGGFVRYAGTLEFSGLNHEIRRERLENLTDSARVYMEGVGATASLSEWCGLRPCTPDGLPMVGAVPWVDGLYLADGHAMMGLTLGPATGRLLADLMVGRPLPVDLSPLRVDRF